MDGMISTSGMIGAGLKKCTPTTRSVCAHAPASAAMDSDDVFDASMAVGATIASSARNSCCLAASCSTIASITTPQGAKAANCSGFTPST